MLRAEWTKLRTVPSTGWFLLATVGLTVAVSAAVATSVDTGFCAGPGPDCPADLTRLSLTGIWLGQAVVAVLAVLAVTNEYDTRMITTTLLANPHRMAVLLARAGVVTAIVLGAGVLTVAGSLLAGWAILPTGGLTAGGGHPWLSVDGPTLRAGAGTVLYLGLVALLSFGIGAIVRDTGGAVATTLGLLYAFPLATLLIGDPQWREWLDRIGPAPAGQAIQATTDLEQLPIGPWAGLGVLAGWAAAAFLLGAIAIHARDA